MTPLPLDGMELLCDNCQGRKPEQLAGRPRRFCSSGCKNGYHNEVRRLKRVVKVAAQCRSKLRCIFCGTTEHIIVDSFGPDREHPRFAVSCEATACQAIGPERATKDAAVIAWIGALTPRQRRAQRLVSENSVSY